ncbi:hypothetical protein CK203_055814 [Vitis vinifera]|uniref:Uncharacterized protein n=1 Tax=Vitis vinifera TaxID=29760 RepID=A0A438H6L3_VITVI|nr:hypothetical protein CK203_055814 [Vitis vinifera]
MRKIWPSEDNCIKLRDNFAPLSRNCNLCMPYWIRDQEGRLVRIENPQDTELDICVNIMDPPPEDQNSQQGQGVGYKPHIVPLLPTFHGMESENPYSHIKEFEEDNGLKRQISNFSAKENEKFHDVGKGIWRPSMLVLIMVLIHGSYKNPEEAMDFLSYVAEVSRGWDEPNSREKGKFPSQQTQNPKAGMYMLSEDVDMKAKVATIARRLEELELKKMHEVQAISDTQVHACHAPFANHAQQQCIYGNTYNSSWRNHPNFSWKPRPPPYQPQGQTQAPQQPSSVEQAIVNLSKVM